MKEPLKWVTIKASNQKVFKINAKCLTFTSHTYLCLLGIWASFLLLQVLGSYTWRASPHGQPHPPGTLKDNHTNLKFQNKQKEEEASPPCFSLWMIVVHKNPQKKTDMVQHPSEGKKRKADLQHVNLSLQKWLQKVVFPVTWFGRGVLFSGITELLNSIVQIKKRKLFQETE